MMETARESGEGRKEEGQGGDLCCSFYFTSEIKAAVLILPCKYSDFR